jgi:hypothetical protein
MTREEWAQYELVQHDPKVLLAMRARCEEQGHEWEHCCSILMQLYQSCKWCKEQR